MTTPTVQKLESFADIDLLIPEREAVSLNGVNCLYMGRNPRRQVRLLIRTGESFMEKTILDESRVNVSNGGIRYSGAGVVSSEHINSSGMASLDHKMISHEGYQKTREYDELMKGVGL